MIRAVMIADDYGDITLGFPYEIDRIYSDGHIRLKNSPRKYLKSSFLFYKDDKKISFPEAYRLMQFEAVKKKLGMK